MNYADFKANAAKAQRAIAEMAGTEKGRRDLEAIAKQCSDQSGKEFHKAVRLTPDGVDILRTSPVAQFITRQFKTMEDRSIGYADLKISFLGKDASVLSVVPLEFIKALKQQGKSCGGPWVDPQSGRFGCLIYWHGDDPKGHWLAFYAEPINGPPTSPGNPQGNSVTMEVNATFFFLVNFLLVGESPDELPKA